MKTRFPLPIAALITMALLSFSCQSETPMTIDITDQLAPNADRGTIVGHLLTAEREKNTTRALSMHFPDMERSTAYAIQNALLRIKEKSDQRIGWKIGYSRVANDTIPSDPIFGHMMATGLYEDGATLSPESFVNGAPLIEAEIAFWIDRDLAGPTVTRDDVIGAVREVAPAIELVSGWIKAAEGKEHTRNHDIAGNVTHVGVVPGKDRYRLGEIDFSKVAVRIEIDGEVKGEGHASMIMNKDPVEALVWLANELRKYGQYLHAGDLVITGTIALPPELGAGQTARAVFETLGTVEVEME